VHDVGYEIRVERRGQSAGVVDAGVPPIALVDWEDRETLVAVADGASGLVRPEPPVPVEQLTYRDSVRTNYPWRHLVAVDTSG
jgi:hypothetical protein